MASSPNFLLPLLLVILITTASAALIKAHNQSCRYVPGDRGWPSRDLWQRLNDTVNGGLIATTPLGHVCHDEGQFAAYDQSACAALQTGIVSTGQQTFLPEPAEPMNPYFETATCSPFTGKDDACDLGSRAVYSIAVRSAADVQAGLTFARENNIRLVVKSTGIDSMGKSTGKGSLGLWMWQLNTTEIIPSYTSPAYSGPAIKLGPGVIAGDVYAAAAAAGYRFVGPECGLVSVAGGYAQGGGHSQLSTAYGLAADQVLEWEVVTARGEHLVATPAQNADLYWALSGGGGGTYGVVLSMIAKAYREGPVAGGTLVFANTSESSYREALNLWFRQAPSFVARSQNNVQFAITAEGFLGFSLTLPDQNTSAIDTLLGPFLMDLDRLEIPYNLSTFDSPSYADHFVKSYGPLPYGDLCPLYVNLASRLIPRATVLDPASSSNLVDVMLAIVQDGNFTIGCSIIDVGASSLQHQAPNAVLPAWRDAIAYCNPQAAWDWEDPEASLKLKSTLVEQHIPAMEAATPGSGTYLNEMDPLYNGDWKGAMYGANYGRLLEIKHANDPAHLMYGHFSVGADEFYTDHDGRLCVV